MSEYKYQRIFHKAYTINKENLNLINNTIEEVLKKHKYKNSLEYVAEIGKHSRYKTNNYAEFLKELENSTKIIKELEISYYENWKKPLYIRLTFTKMYSQLSITCDKKDIVDILSSRINSILKESVYRIFSYDIIMKILTYFIIAILSLFLFRFVYRELLNRNNDYVELIGISWLLFPFLIIQLLTKLFPEHIIIFGYSKSKYDRIIEIRKIIFIILGLGIIASIIGSLVAPLISSIFSK